MTDPEPPIPAPLRGVRIVEVATHVFVPMAGAVLTEWGADVVKVEHPETGDPYRSLVTAGLHNVYRGVDPFFQSANRGKRSVGIDLKHADGRNLLTRLLRDADVFMTNLREDARRRLRLDVEDIRADSPSIVYVRGTAFGARGPDAGRGGYDSGSYWARSGMQHILTRPDAPWPAATRPAFGDVVGGLTIAGAVSAALFQRATTGAAPVVDASLLASGMWQIQPDIVNAKLGDEDTHPRAVDRYEVRNPLMLPYRTRDGRFVALMMLAPERYWADFCHAIGRPELVSDPRFATMDARDENARACVELLEAAFAARDLDEWQRALAGFAGEWATVQTPREVHDDPQVQANGYVVDVDVGNGVSIPLLPSPVQFDQRPGEPVRAPEHGEHTEAVLLELGVSWDEITALKRAGAIL
jgi:crotonobetainyl-CoA:carnitine CoA-transferase CaiB-like acyl-CoA transferase